MISVHGKSLFLVAAFCISCSFVESTNDLSCNFHPSLWCSSKQIARSCQVEDQCRANVWSEQLVAPKVNLSLYYEALCPDCQQFTTEQLWPTFLQISEIFNLELIPYGNAREKQVGDKWEFTCQHGPMECLGNLIATCTLHIMGNVSKTMPFIECMEASHSSPDVSGPVCAKQHGVDYKAVLDCTNSPLGNKLEHEMAVKTDQLDPPHQYVPWITLNGVHTEEMQEEASRNLRKLICDNYTGIKPKGCQTEVVWKCSRY